MSTTRAAIVLVFDRLRPHFLGPYGGTWCETPACNRLAAEGYLAEQALSDSDCLEAIYRSYWSGRHAACRSLSSARHDRDALPPGLALAERLHAAGVATELVTDDPLVASHRWGESFGERLLLPRDEEPTTAESAGSMRVAQLLAAAADRWSSLSNHSLLWVHAAAWNDAWDAPWSFRAELADEEDPEPPTLVVPPSKDCGGKCDPDEVLGYLHAYVGQVAAWDACLEAWLEAFAASGLADDRLLIVTSPRGFPLGEHGMVGDASPALRGELLQVPFFLRYPEARWPLVRDQAFVQPADLYATLVDWFELDASAPTATGAIAIAEAGRRGPSWGESLLPAARGESSGRRDIAVAVADGQFALRTPDWFLRLARPIDSTERASHHTPTSDEGEPVELYVKPDDRWEVNEIKARCEGTVEALVGFVPVLREALDQAGRAGLPPLPEVARNAR